MFKQINYKDIPKQFHSSFWYKNESCWYCGEANNGDKAFWIERTYNPPYDARGSSAFLSFCDENCSNLWILEKIRMGYV